MNETPQDEMETGAVQPPPPVQNVQPLPEPPQVPPPQVPPPPAKPPAALMRDAEITITNKQGEVHKYTHSRNVYCLLELLGTLEQSVADDVASISIELCISDNSRIPIANGTLPEVLEWLQKATLNRQAVMVYLNKVCRELVDCSMVKYMSFACLIDDEKDGIGVVNWSIQNDLLELRQADTAAYLNTLEQLLTATQERLKQDNLIILPGSKGGVVTR